MEHPLFRAGEILEMAVRIEHRGLSFYRACLESELEDNVRAVFEFMIGQERRHIQIFEEMKSRVRSESPIPESYPGEMQSYIKGFVHNRVFYEPEKAAEETAEMHDVRRAIDFALGFEQRSVDFYQEIKRSVRATEHSEIDRIIQEEQNHIKCLDTLRREIEQAAH
jgi:rubrerythrin